MSKWKEVFAAVKAELKSEGKAIRALKRSRKQDKRTESLWKIDGKIQSAARRFRHKHIAYCEMRFGTSRDAIEQPDEDNLPYEKMIQEFKDQWEEMIDGEEALRVSA